MQLEDKWARDVHFFADKTKEIVLKLDYFNPLIIWKKSWRNVEFCAIIDF